MSEFVSISALSEELEIVSGKMPKGSIPLLWDMQLPPHVDNERLQVNMSRLKTLHRVGAMTASHVMSYEGDVTETTPTIVGVNADGSAFAGVSSTTKKAEQTRSSYEELEDLPRRSRDTFGWPIMAHRINKSEAASRVVDITREGRTSEQAWGRVLDEALRQSLREGGRQHLTQRTPRLMRSFFYANTLGFVGALSGITETAIVGSPFSFALMHTIALTEQQILKNRGYHARRRWSIVPLAAQPDRYLALNALSRIPGLIQTRQ